MTRLLCWLLGHRWSYIKQEGLAWRRQCRWCPRKEFYGMTQQQQPAEGEHGCHGMTKRRGVERSCRQEAVAWDREGRGWCYYHNPEMPRKFGEPYEGRRR